MPVPRYEDREKHMWGIIRAVLAAADPAAAVERVVRTKPPRRPAPGRPLRVIAVGKAAIGMERGLRRALASLEDWRGVEVESFFRMTTRGTPDAGDLPGTTIFGDHPIPSRENEQVAAELERKIRELGLRTPSVSEGQTGKSLPERLVLLLSGGASALLSLPWEGLTLDDLAEVTKSLMHAGADIDELNCVRKHCERLKGGRLAVLASQSRATVDGFLISDVIGDWPDVIGSGPISPDPTEYSHALRIVQSRLHGSAPVPILRHLQAGLDGNRPETPKAAHPAFDWIYSDVIASNEIAVRSAVSAAEEAGFDAFRAPRALSGLAEVAGALIGQTLSFAVERASEIAVGAPPTVLVFGGETTVAVKGPGKGGRNQELVLGAVRALLVARAETRPIWAMCSIASDGVDGPTDAAGAWIDADAINLVKSRRMEPLDYLSSNNSYEFFERIGRLIKTGPTGTNVNDVCVGLVYPPGGAAVPAWLRQPQAAASAEVEPPDTAAERKSRPR